MATTYKIHPAIGVARLGTATPVPSKKENYYLAPTEQGALPSDPQTGQPVTTFRDAEGRLLKQAAQFHVYAYEDGQPEGEPVEISGDGVKAIEWTVYLANKKAAWYKFTQLSGSGPWPKQVGPWPDPALAAATSYQEAEVKLRDNEQVQDRQKLILDPGPRTVGGSQPQSATFALPPGPTMDPQNFKPNPISHLGGVFAEQDGTLLVFAGDGDSGTTNLKPTESPGYEYAITNYANNAGWFDDVADGPVHATLIMHDDSRVEVDVSAWCLAAPPKYAPQIVNVVNLFDTIFDIAVREQNYRPDLFKNGQFNPDYVVDYELEIAPFLSRPDLYQWAVNLTSNNAALEHQSVRTNGAWDKGFLFNVDIVRSPDRVNNLQAAHAVMPRLAGDAPFGNSVPQSLFLALTQTQYFLLNQWNAGKAKETVPGRKPTAGQAIDFGVLKNCVGGAFCPGIEITWISRHTGIYSEPFRIKAKTDVAQGKLDALNGDDNQYKDGVEPGDLSKYMAQPWQADFKECSSQGDVTGGQNPTKDWWWWPAQRPYDVIPDGGSNEYASWTRDFHEDTPSISLGDMQMVIDWQHLGFLKGEEKIVEVERQTDQIKAYQDPVIPSDTQEPPLIA